PVKESGIARNPRHALSDGEPAASLYRRLRRLSVAHRFRWGGNVRGQGGPQVLRLTDQLGVPRGRVPKLHRRFLGEPDRAAARDERVRGVLTASSGRVGKAEGRKTNGSASRGAILFAMRGAISRQASRIRKSRRCRSGRY